MTTAACNADNPFAVVAGVAGGRGTGGATGYVLCHQPKSFDWRVCGGRVHPTGRVSDVVFAQVLLVLHQVGQLA